MDDLFDDYDDGFDEIDDGCNDYWDDEPDIDEDEPTESGEGPWDGLEWQDWMIIGPLSEEIAREKQEQERIRKDFDKKDDEI